MVSFNVWALRAPLQVDMEHGYPPAGTPPGYHPFAPAAMDGALSKNLFFEIFLGLLLSEHGKNF
jgi:hypothetical protein